MDDEPKTITYQGIPIRYFQADNEPPLVSADDLAALVRAGHATNQSDALALATRIISPYA